MAKQKIKYTKEDLLELLLLNSDLNISVNSKSSEGKKIRRYIRQIAKASHLAVINIKKGNEKPKRLGITGRWCLSLKNAFKKTKNNAYFKYKPYAFYHHSDYRVEVGEQWIQSLLNSNNETK